MAVSNYHEPYFNIDRENNRIDLSGRSTIEYAYNHYMGIIEKVKEYIKEKPEKVDIHVKLDYFNTTSSKCILDLFKTFREISMLKHNITIYWYYEEDDEDIKEAGMDYSEILTYIKFEFVEF
jgi:hypothetical protein